MKANFLPKGRKNLPVELVKFGRNLVYSEGIKTEPYYIESIKKSIGNKYKCNPNDIEIVPVNKEDKSYNTLGLVEYAIKDVNERLKKHEFIDHVWLFFDKDSFPKEDFYNAHKKIIGLNNSENENVYGFKYQKENGIVWHSCATNEAFELWLCLYFDNIQNSMGRKDYIVHLNNIQKLKNIGFNYEKNQKDIHQILSANGGNIKNAIKWAKKLCENNILENPSSYIYEFAEFFYPYLFEK